MSTLRKRAPASSQLQLELRGTEGCRHRRGGPCDYCAPLVWPDDELGAVEGRGFAAVKRPQPFHGHHPVARLPHGSVTLTPAPASVSSGDQLAKPKRPTRGVSRRPASPRAVGPDLELQPAAACR
jgi:hypothetical protein